VIKVSGAAYSSDLLANDIGDHFLRCDYDKVALVTILQAQQLGPSYPIDQIPASSAGYGRHQARSLGSIHLLAHHRPTFRNFLFPRKPGVDAGGDPDHAGPQHQAMAGELGLGRRFLERCQKSTAYTRTNRVRKARILRETLAYRTPTRGTRSALLEATRYVRSAAISASSRMLLARGFSERRSPAASNE
jgi:hypothetical protein